MIRRGGWDYGRKDRPIKVYPAFQPRIEPNVPVASVPVPPVIPAGIAPALLSVTINDLTPDVGQVLTASAIATGNPLPSVSFVWEASSDGVTWVSVGVAPSISSVTINDTTPETGQVLTASAVVTGSPPLSVSYQWQSSPDGVTWSDV